MPGQNAQNDLAFLFERSKEVSILVLQYVLSNHSSLFYLCHK